MTGFDAERARAQKIVIATDEEIADVVDAITGATWNTRNTIMRIFSCPTSPNMVTTCPPTSRQGSRRHMA